jgi:hypothetical protein
MKSLRRAGASMKMSLRFPLKEKRRGEEKKKEAKHTSYSINSRKNHVYQLYSMNKVGI